MAFEGWEEAQTTEDFFSALDDNTEIGTSAEEIIDKVIEEEGNTPDKNKPTISLCSGTGSISIVELNPSLMAV